MKYILCTIGIIGSYYLLRYRERIGDMIGEAEWMKKIGGVYMVIIIFAIFLFFWCVAELTNTTDFLFGPILSILPLPHATPSTAF